MPDLSIGSTDAPGAAQPGERVARVIFPLFRKQAPEATAERHSALFRKKLRQLLCPVLSAVYLQFCGKIQRGVPWTLILTVEALRPSCYVLGSLTALLHVSAAANACKTLPLKNVTAAMVSTAQCTHTGSAATNKGHLYPTRGSTNPNRVD
eukprot:554514-Amphidinium_carterae.1